jgi:phospho-N-acetylmuramoyl-pentapeptide-transferase
MFFALIQHYLPWLEEHNLGFLRVFLSNSFQAIASVVLSFALVVSIGPAVIRRLTDLKIKDNPDFDQADINKLMENKKGVPTMGGVLIVGSITLTTLLLANVRNYYVIMAVCCGLLLAALGATDDYLKLTRHRRQETGRQGLTSIEKLLFQFGLAALLSYFTYRYGEAIPAATQFFVPTYKLAVASLGVVAFVVIGTVFLAGFSNAVNLTDGLDGLAAGCTALASFVFLILAVIIGDLTLSSLFLFPHIREAGQMAPVAGAIAGACMGFLWFNCYPARVFMGDTGSLSLGGLLAYVAIVLRQELLLILVGGVFIFEALSVAMQVSYFKYTRKRFGEGRRIFKMAPVHHHFQKLGWVEPKVVIRFWLIAAMLAALGLATIKLR